MKSLPAIKQYKSVKSMTANKSSLEPVIKIHHNFDDTKFKWLWAKYVREGNLEHHCTNCLKGKYSSVFSNSSNSNLLSQPVIEMNEVPIGEYKAIYFCGVIKKGYPKSNYNHNVHFAVIPEEGASSHWEFEDWKVDIENGVLSEIPSEDDLDDRFFTGKYDEHYYTCRIFRWMVGFFYPEHLYSYWKLEKDEDEIAEGITLSKKTDAIKSALSGAGYSIAETAFETLTEIYSWDDEEEIEEKKCFLDAFMKKDPKAISRFEEQFGEQWNQSYNCDMHDFYFDESVLAWECLNEDWMWYIRDEAEYKFSKFIYEGADDFFEEKFGFRISED